MTPTITATATTTTQVQQVREAYDIVIWLVGPLVFEFKWISVICIWIGPKLFLKRVQNSIMDRPWPVDGITAGFK